LLGHHRDSVIDASEFEIELPRSIGRILARSSERLCDFMSLNALVDAPAIRAIRQTNHAPRVAARKVDSIPPARDPDSPWDREHLN
jgi:hypothetical protein